MSLAQGVTLHQIDGAVEVRDGGELFTRYVYRDTPKPILYPIVGPHGIAMTRNFPMRDDAPGEANDHVHHRSLWFAHGDVNGADFWLEGPAAGKIVHDRLGPLEKPTRADRAELTAYSNWIAPEGEVVCREKRRMTFVVASTWRAIDLRITLTADEGPLVFGDTKEGMMALRVRPELRLRPDAKRGGLPRVFGQAVNSEGQRGNAAWGQPARWVDYSGPVADRRVGVAIFDHPTNLRHPTRWHARAYGLVAANPFGLHDFAGTPRGEGRYETPAGQPITFRYRFLFHEGDAPSANLEAEYAAWIGD